MTVSAPETLAKAILARRKKAGQYVLPSERYREFGRRYYNRRADFMRDIIRWPKPTEQWADYQLDLAATLDHEDWLAARGSRGLGKTAVEAALVHHFALTRDALELDWKGITTASIGQQLTLYLWPEIHKQARMIDWRKVGREPYRDRGSHIELMKTQLRLRTGQWASVISPDADRQEGAHADEMMLIFTEAKIIPAGVWDSAEGYFSTDGVGKWIAFSTPSGGSGRFYEIFQRRPGLQRWATRRITLHEAIAAGRVSAEWAENLRLRLGEDHPLYQAQVLGEFASDEEDGVIPLMWVEQAIERNDSKDPESPVVALAFDVGGGKAGNDASTIAMLTADRRVLPLVKIEAAHDPSVATMELVGIVAGLIRKHQATLRHANGDINGIGAGVVHRLREMGFRVFGFNAAARTDRIDDAGMLGFANVRAGAWWATRELLDPQQGAKVGLPDDDDLKADLVSTRLKRITSASRRVMEDKDAIRKRIGRSPDAGDAVVQVLTGVLFEEEAMAGQNAGPVEIYRRGLERGPSRGY